MVPAVAKQVTEDDGMAQGSPEDVVAGRCQVEIGLAGDYAPTALLAEPGPRARQATPAMPTLGCTDGSWDHGFGDGGKVIRFFLATSVQSGQWPSVVSCPVKAQCHRVMCPPV